MLQHRTNSPLFFFDSPLDPSFDAKIKRWNKDGAAPTETAGKAQSSRPQMCPARQRSPPQPGKRPVDLLPLPPPERDRKAGWKAKGRTNSRMIRLLKKQQDDYTPRQHGSGRRTRSPQRHALARRSTTRTSADRAGPTGLALAIIACPPIDGRRSHIRRG